MKTPKRATEATIGETQREKSGRVVSKALRTLVSEGRRPELAPLKGGGLIIGYVDEIHGEGGVECGAYKFTRYELLLVAGYWAEQILDIELDWFYNRQADGEECRLEAHAEARLDGIAKVIGKAAVEKAIAEVESEHRECMDEEHWRIFAEGTEEERAAFANEIQRKLNDAAENTPPKGKAGRLEV
jgi:hypothetical protein